MQAIYEKQTNTLMNTTTNNLTAGLRRSLTVVAAAATMLSLLGSCKENKKTDEDKSFVEGVVIPTDNTAECSMSEANITVTFQTKDGYTLEVSDPEMLAIHADDVTGAAAGNHSARVTVAANNTSEERQADIFITVKGYNRTVLYSIKQSGGAEDPVVTWVDKRLTNEYYWLDEYKEKRPTFDFSLTYDRFLSSSLLSLTTNEMDGGRNSDGTRYIYSYIVRTGPAGSSSGTRVPAQTTGLGLYLTNTVWQLGPQLYGFAVEHVYPGSPADKAGIQRGDIIAQVNSMDITQSNMEDLWMNLNYGGYSQVKLRKINWWAGSSDEENATVDVDLTAGGYFASPVAYHGVLEMPEAIADKPNKIGYLSYMSFDAAYDDSLAAAMADLKAAGVTDLILDLRSNGGGSVNSSIKLASMILDASYAGKTYAKLKRNPLNPYGDDECLLTEQATNLGIKHLYIIATGNTASASEMVIAGLRGLDVPVTIIGSRTEGKNCGMDVMTATIDRYDYEFAPITFLNFNAKDFNDYADGFEADVDVVEYFADDANLSHVNNSKMFPMPLAPWGMATYDIALYEAMMRITGGTLKTETAEPTAPAAVTRGFMPATVEIARPEIPGMTLTEQERDQIREVQTRR